MYKDRFFRIYKGIKYRCSETTNISTHFYGGRGIKNYWENFNQFKIDMYDSYIEHCNIFGEKQTTIDRIDNNGNYCKENCRRATIREQNLNKSNTLFLKYKGKKIFAIDFCKQFNLKYNDVTKLKRKGKSWLYIKRLYNII